MKNNDKEVNSENHLKEIDDLVMIKKSIMLCFFELSRAQREIMILFYKEGFSVGEISQVFGCGINEIRKQLIVSVEALESNIKTYEKNQGVNLHATIVLPFLGGIFEDHQQFLCQKEKTHFHF